MMQAARNYAASHVSGPSNHIARTTRVNTAYPRKRAVTACQVCRGRRTRCDQKRPCSFCEAIGADCVYEPAALGSFDPASLAILDKLDRLERRLEQSIETAPKRAPRSLVNTLTSPAQSQLGAFLPTPIDAVLRWSIYRELITPAQSTSPLDIVNTPAPSFDYLGSTIELDPSCCHTWLDNFFEEVNIKNPVLDEGATRRMVRQICLDGVGWDTESCLALLVCANGAVIRPFPSLSITQDVDMAPAMSLFRAAQKRLGPVLTKSGVIQAQCAFLAGVFLMSILLPVDAWRMFLQALSICQTLPRTPRAQDDGTPEDHTGPLTEGSLYWACWKSEQELRHEIGCIDGTVPFFNPPNMFPSLPQGCEGKSLRAWYFYLAEISLWRLEMETKREVIRILETTEEDQVLDAIANLSDQTREQMDAWQNSLPPTMSLAEPDLTTNGDDITKFVLQGRTTYIFELITWAFVHKVAYEGRLDQKTSSRAAEGLASHLHRLHVNCEGFYHRHHGTWLMMRSSARSACILLAFGQNPILAELMPSGWLVAVKKALAMLEFWSEQKEEFKSLVHPVQSLLSNMAV
jgi:hypothetical protein